jgi:hypothetical protein
MEDSFRSIGQSLRTHRSIAGAEVDRFRRDEFLTLTRANPLVVKVYLFINFAKGSEPFGIERIRKGGAATQEDYSSLSTMRVQSRDQKEIGENEKPKVAIHANTRKLSGI